MSFIVIQKLVIDFSQDAPYLYIGAKSGEINGRTIEFIPVIKGEPIDLSNIVSARFEGKKADGNVVLLDGEIKEGHIFVTFTPQSVNVFGLVEAEIGLYGSNMDLAYSQYIYIDVYESIVGDHEHESFPELDSLRIALLTIDKEVKEAKDATKEAVLSAENANSAAENLEQLKNATVEATENANQSAESANTEAKNALDASLLANEAAQAANEAKESASNAAENANATNESVLSAEQDRAKNEEIRKESETLRAEKELKRISDEDVRVQNENERVIAENERSAKFEELSLSAEGLIDDANTALESANSANASATEAYEKAQEASEKATTILDDAQGAISYANESAENANEAAGNANFVYEKASTIIPVMEELLEDSEDAIKNANSSAQNANTAANLASDAAQSANDAAVVAMNASKEAAMQEVRQNAVLATNNANNAAEEANQSAKDADLAKEDALLAKQEALSAAETARNEAANAVNATQNANNAADAAIEASKEASLQAARDAANTAAESANAAADRATSFLDGAEDAENERNLNEIGRVSAEENRRKEFATWEIELGKISAFDKRIENLEAAVTPGLVTPTVDDSVAYIKNVPTGALPNAMISEIGGMTYNVNGVLRDAKVTAVESVGVNLIPFSYKDASKTTNGITFTVNGDGTVTVNGTATELAEINIQYNVEKNTLFRKGTTYTVSDGVRDSSALNYYMYVNAVGSDGVEKTVMGTHTPTARSYTCDDDSFTGTVIRLVIVKGVTVSNLVFKPMLNRGEFALPYVQYKKHTLSIPEAVRALDGYGFGINATTYNRIDLEKKKFVKRVKRGTIDHVAPTQYIYNNIQYYASPKPTDFIGYGGVSDSFDVPGFRLMNYTTWDDASHIGSMSGKADYQDLWFGFPIGTTLEEAQSVLLGLPIVYELATPIETDLSNYFGDDNLIGVEGGGTVTMENEYEYAVPSVIEYTVKGVDAT